MRRVGGLVEVGLMAGDAGGRLALEDAVGVATGACHREVRAGERKLGRVVVEAGAGPCGGGVTGRAGGDESRRGVRRVGGLVEIGLMAGDAGGRLPLEDTVAVAAGAGDGLVRTGERKLRGGVVEAGAGPCGGGVTGRAGGDESRRGVRRVGGLVEVRLVAGDARGRLALEDAVAVTAGAGNGLVRTGERKQRGGVVERGALPRRGGVAAGTLVGERRRGVGRVGGLVEVRLMARGARGRLALEDAVAVTAGARHRPVSAGERKGARVMVERRTLPGRLGVTGFARGRKAGAGVRRIRGVIEVGAMAADAAGGESAVLRPPGGAGNVARLAWCGRVRPPEREPGLLVNPPQACLIDEAPGGVAAGAIDTQFAAVHVVVTRRTGGGCLREVERLVTGGAWRPDMGAVEGEHPLGVAERRGDAHRPPAIGTVAFSAGADRCAVRVGRDLSPGRTGQHQCDGGNRRDDTTPGHVLPPERPWQSSQRRESGR